MVWENGKVLGPDDPSLVLAGVSLGVHHREEGGEEMKVRVEKDIVIPAGMILHDAPRRTVRYEPFGEAIIGFGKDHTGSFTIDLDAIEAHPDQFTVLER